MQSIIVIVFGIVIVSFVEANPIVGQNKTDRGFITIIDQIINLGSVPKCATGQGQPGYCTIGTCPNLGNFSSVGCTGRNRFIKCCPNEVAFERYPTLGKKGKYLVLFESYISFVLHYVLFFFLNMTIID